jgi:DNA-directed RNA polymerase specialized sigma24 family protein
MDFDFLAVDYQTTKMDQNQRFAHFAHNPLLAAERFVNRPGPQRDDYFSEAAEAVLRGLAHAGPGVRDMESFLFRCAMNACRNLRRSHIRAFKTANGAAWTVADERNPAVGHFLQVADFNRVVMGHLTPRQRRIVRAAAKGCSVQSIAQREQLSRQHIRRERNRITQIATELVK